MKYSFYLTTAGVYFLGGYAMGVWHGSINDVTRQNRIYGYVIGVIFAILIAFIYENRKILFKEKKEK